MRQAGFFNAPNIVSFSRLVLAALFIAIGNTRVRLGLLILSALTDFLDGWLARRSSTASRSGPLVDAIADRVFALTATCVLLVDQWFSIWFALVLLSRDVMTAVGFIVARIIPWLRRVPFKARFAGKVVTVLQYLTLIAVLGAARLVTVLIGLVAILSALAIADYTLALWRGRAMARGG